MVISSSSVVLATTTMIGWMSFSPMTITSQPITVSTIVDIPVVELTSPEFKDLLDQRYFDAVIDVRDLEGWNSGHIEGTMHMDSLTLYGTDNQVSTPMDLMGCESCTIAVYCNSGGQARMGIEILKDAGFVGRFYNGLGVTQWAAEGYPLSTTSPSVPAPCSMDDAAITEQCAAKLETFIQTNITNVEDNVMDGTETNTDTDTDTDGTTNTNTDTDMTMDTEDDEDEDEDDENDGEKDDKADKDDEMNEPDDNTDEPDDNMSEPDDNMDGPTEEPDDNMDGPTEEPDDNIDQPTEEPDDNMDQPTEEPDDTESTLMPAPTTTFITPTQLTSEEFKELIDNSFFDVIIDVRSRGEWEEGHIEGATLMEDLNLYGTADQASEPMDLEGCESCTIGVYCQSGGRAARAIEILQANDQINFVGRLYNGLGVGQWTQSGFPLSTSAPSVEPPCASDDATTEQCEAKLTAFLTGQPPDDSSNNDTSGNEIDNNDTSGNEIDNNDTTEEGTTDNIETTDETTTTDTMNTTAPTVTVDIDPNGSEPNLDIMGGGSCSAAPACAAKNLTGACCPSIDNVFLDCCNPGESSVKGTCDNNPQCVDEDMGGNCCPTPEGIYLTCCKAVPDDCFIAQTCRIISSLEYTNEFGSQSGSSSTGAMLLVSALVAIIGSAMLL